MVKPRRNTRSSRKSQSPENVPSEQTVLNSDKKLKVLCAKRKYLLDKTRSLLDLTTKFPDELAIEEFKTNIKGVDEVKIQFERVCDEINYAKLDINADCPIDYNVLEDFNKLIREIEIANIKLGETKNKSKTVIKLPRLELPSFDGDLSKWTIFKETFEKVVHQNDALSPQEKVQFLLGKLSGRALQTISSLPATGENYETIWNRLNAKYHDKTKLSKFYVQQMFSYKNIGHESGQALENFLENFAIAYEGLQNTKLPCLSDFIILQLALTKLDSETVKNFEMFVRETEIPTFEQLRTFLQQQSKILNQFRSSLTFKTQPKSGVENKRHTFLISKPEKIVGDKICKFCKTHEHHLYECEKFLAASTKEKFNFVKTNHYCFNCLSPYHSLKNCKSSKVCNECKNRHHTLLHFNDHTNNKIDNGESTTSKFVGTTFASSNNKNSKFEGQKKTVLLGTAYIKVQTQLGNNLVRVLVDSASQSNLITKKCCDKLGLPSSRIWSSILGIGNAQSKVLGKTQFQFTSLFDDTIYNIDALIVNNICGKLPSVRVDNSVKPFLIDLNLADKNFDCPGDIDAILGAEIFPLLVKEKKVKVPHMSCHAIDTHLGFIVMGNAPTLTSFEPEVKHSFLTIEEPLEVLLQKFWEIENLGENENQNSNSECEFLFNKGMSRGYDGRYIVQLPFSGSSDELGDSKNCAIKRFLMLENKFKRTPELKIAYTKLINEFLDKNYLSLIGNAENINDGYFVPHHGVLKKESSTTPLRIVFDASTKTSSGKSLNDILHVGPKLQANPLNILINFRIFKFVLGADIRQMYLQILLDEKHTKFQRILWRFNSNEPIKVFELKRVAFGLRSSPYLALRVVQQLIHDEHKNYPLACEFVPRDMYVDDVICSVSNVKSGIKLCKQLMQLFRSGGFELGKWISNSSEILKHCSNKSSTRSNINFHFSASTKVLGLRWEPESDVFLFDFEPPSELATKRNILSTVARMFDPLGLIGPIILCLKILIKQLWQVKLSWDDLAPKELEKTWLQIVQELKLVSDIKIPRHILIFEDTVIDLVGFCDGSEKAYGAVVYVLTKQPDNQVNSMLLCSKSKVTPMKGLTLPRIELCGANLLSDIIKFIVSCLGQRVIVNRIIALSDSQIVLNWIQSTPERWQTFVANRVRKIQESVNPSCWYYVMSKDNPADIISRGALPSKLKDNKFWWHGPTWLINEFSRWPVSREFSKKDISHLEQIPVNIQTLVITHNDNLIVDLCDKISSWPKLLRIICYILKFAKKLSFSNRCISASDLIKAEHYVLKINQQLYFSKEIQMIKEGKPFNSPLLKLRPFLDQDILRVGGRLKNSELTFDHKFPVLISTKSNIATLIVDYYHLVYCHPGPNVLISLIRHKFWITNIRQLVKKRIGRCIGCFKMKPVPGVAQMADLPKCRVSESRVFEHTGVDYAGPFYVLLKRARGQRRNKVWICLFVCMATKAVHLEVCTDLSTQSFLDALKRFVARRGPCNTLYSDQGTNFCGANNLLKELYKLVNSDDHRRKFGEFLSDHRITWKFNPPGAPHFGGLWESLVKSLKRHLFKTIGCQILTLEEFQTVCIQVEAILNSRPITPLSDDPSEPCPLTPAHFLVGKPLTQFPMEVSNLHLGRPKLMETIVKEFWRRWRREYLHQLQTRQKWLKPETPIAVGCPVLLMEPNIPPLSWPMAIIEKIFPANDGQVRVVKVRTNKGSYVRPIVKVCPLPIN